MSDSDSSLDATILARITRKRDAKQGETKPKIIGKVVRRRRRAKQVKFEEEPINERQVQESEPPTEESGKTDDVSNFETTTPSPQQKVEPQIEQSQIQASINEEREKLEEEKKLAEAHTEAKRLKRVQTRGEVKPSPKVRKIVKRRPKNTEPEDSEEEDETQSELMRLREEMAEMKKALSQGFNNGNQYAPRPANDPAILSDRQSNLLMGLLGRG